MAGSILGNRVLRKEDPKFLTTGGVYVDDLLDEPLLAGAAHVTYVRSTVAHGRILDIDTSAALAMPGVIAVYTAADLGLEPVPATFNPTVARGLLAIDKVRFVGEPVAVVVTETARAGRGRRRAGDHRLRRARRVDRHRGSDHLDHAALRGRRQQRRVRHHGARHARQHRRRVLRRLRGRRSRGRVRQPARRPVPARGPRLGGRLGATDGAPAPVAQHARRAQGAQDASSPGNGVEADAGARHHPRRRRRLRRQDRLRPGGDPARRASPRWSAGRCAGARPAANR